MPTQFFTDGSDTYTVTAAGDYSLAFLDGNDRLTVNGGTFTTAVMGEGADLITLQSGDGIIYGDGGSDRFVVYGSGFEAKGGADNDLFEIRGGNNLILRGDGGDDTYTFYTGTSGIVIRGGDGNDVFNGSNQVIAGNIYGDAGNDVFTGFRNAGAVVNLRGGVGNDIYRATPTSPASFIEQAGEGIDSVEVAGGHSYTLGANIENLTAGAFAGAIAGRSTLAGNELNNVITGYANPETLNGLAGNDRLNGGAGNDTLNGGDGNDMLDGQTGIDAMNGGAGSDTYYVDNAGDVITEMAAAAATGGLDLVRTIIDYTLPDYVENGTIDSPNGIELTGNNSNNVLTGGAGFDALAGSAGNDVLRGGPNRDYMAGGTGNDRYYVDHQLDQVFEVAGEGTDTVYVDLVLAPPDDFGPPPLPPTYVMSANVENLVVTRFGQGDGFGGVTTGFVGGNALGNVITDSNDTRTISGAAGDDTINGNGGDDYLIGADGRDTISGGSGDDVIVGDGNGVVDVWGDTLTGGAGADSFWYYTAAESAPFILRADQITDFETGSDSIHLNDDADVNTTGTQNWTVVDSPTGAAGQLWIDSSDSANGNYTVFGDNDGDGLADLMINVHALAGFSAADIVL